MEIDGYKLREILKANVIARDTASTMFDRSIFAFEDEQKEDPKDVMERFRKHDHAVAEIEAAQQRYNERVTINVQGTEMSMSLAVKLIGGSGRCEKMWRSAAVRDGKDRYSRDDTRRDKDSEYASRTISYADCAKAADEAARFAAALRAAIAKGNATTVDSLEIGLRPEFLS